MFYSSVDPVEGDRRFVLRGLDGLRAIAVTLVVLYHLFPATVPGGAMGVDIFFVISGYLITALLLREGAYTGRMNIIQFWIRRARRLLPAMLVLIITVASLAFLIGGDVQVGLPRQIIGALTFSSNWLYIASGNDYFAQTSPELLTNFWSLAVEEQFYIFWPVVLVLVFMFVSRWSHRLLVPVVLGVLSLLIAETLGLLDAGASRAYYGTDSHLFGLMLGVALALLIPWSMYPPVDARLYPVVGFGNGWQGLLRAVLGWACLVAMYPLAMSMTDATAGMMPWGLLLASVLSVGVIQALLADVRNPLARLLRGVLSFPVFVWIGRRSYGIYLWHWPLAVLAHYLFGPNLNPWIRGAVVVLTLLIAGLSYMFIEEPVRRHGFFPSLRSWGSAMVGPAKTAPIVCLAVAALAVAGTVAAVRTAPELTEAEQVVAAAGPGGGQVKKPAPAASSASPSAEPQPSGSAAPAQLQGVSIIGDSVTVASSSELSKQLPQASIDAAVSRTLVKELPELERQADAGQLGRIVVISLNTNSTLTAQQLDEVVDRLAHDKQRRIIFVTGVAPSGLEWVASSNAEVHAAAKRHPEVVSVADWAQAAAGHPEYLVSDGVHPEANGQAVYAKVIADEVARVQKSLQEHPEAPNAPAHSG